MFSTFTEPTDWVLKIPTDLSVSLWNQPAPHITTWGKWNAYLNRLALETCLSWLKAEHCPNAAAWLDQRSMNALNEFVNGFAILIGDVRVAFMPTETIDQTMLEVPQEWVDIPSWAADYYVAIQVDMDTQELRIYGYTTHQALKVQKNYDAGDRTYCLDTEDLNADLNGLWLSYARCPATQTRSSLATIPSIASVQADALIERWGNGTEPFPRLEIPFVQWAALMADANGRQRLYQQRQTGHSTNLARNLTTRLSQWFDGQIETMWQSLDQVLVPQQVAIAIRGTAQETLTDQEIYRAKVLHFEAGQLALVIGISQIDLIETQINLQIHPDRGTPQLPDNTQLRLLTRDGQELGQASAAVTEIIQFQFRANQGEQFQIAITCAGQTLTEQFEL
jgi:Protein of unknown function (DUF1822)